MAEFSLQFLLYSVLIARLRKDKGPSFRIVIITAVVARVALWFTAPVLENDFWRYLWDGRVLAHGVNPYLYAPVDSPLNWLDIGYRKQIGWAQFGTIYPPFSELLFGATHLLAPDSLLGLKVMLTAFDLGVGLVLMRWLSCLGRNPAWALLYFLNPLVLKEIANSAHLDSIPVFFTMIALYWMTTAPTKSFWAWMALALGACSKLYPLVLVPLFVCVDPRWKKNIVVALAVSCAIYLPFLGAGWKLLGGTGAYAKYWIFNAGVFQLTTLALNGALGIFRSFTENPFFKEALKNDYPAKLVLGLLFLFLMIWRARKLRCREELPQAALWVLGAILIVSPVVDPWYLLWVLPLACLLGSLPWLAFSYLVVASYAWFYSKHAAPYFRMTEYGLFLSLLFIAWRRPGCTVLKSKESCNPPQTCP